MKFDIVRAWKDESYRQSLSEAQLNTLPINPVGELDLTDAELAAIYGGGGGFGAPAVAPAVGGLGVPALGGTGVGAGAGESSSLASSERIHSFAMTCDVNIFSFNLISLSHLGLTSILSPTTQICANND